MNYEQAFTKIPTMYKEFKDNADAKTVYETIICNTDNISSMIQYSNCGLPALNAVCDAITKYAADGNCTFVLDKKTRAFFGNLISLVLSEFGYVQISRGRVTTAKSSMNSFTTGAKYSYDAKAPKTKTYEITIKPI